MGEIDRIQPVFRPLLQPKPAEHVQPAGSDKRDHRQSQDSVELGSRPEPDDTEDETLVEPDSADSSQPEHGLDLSV